MMFDSFLGLLIGLFLLLFGQRFFWLAAGFIAFLFGWQIISNLIGDGWLSFLLGIMVGITFAWLAVRFIRVVAYILAFLIGAFVFTVLFEILGLELNTLLLVLFGGIVGVIVVGMAFDWALILFTAWAGTSTIMIGLQQWVTLSGALASITFGLMLLLGVVWQSSWKLKIGALRRVWG